MQLLRALLLTAAALFCLAPGVHGCEICQAAEFEPYDFLVPDQPGCAVCGLYSFEPYDFSMPWDDGCDVCFEPYDFSVPTVAVLPSTTGGVDIEVELMLEGGLMGSSAWLDVFVNSPTLPEVGDYAPIYTSFSGTQLQPEGVFTFHLDVKPNDLWVLDIVVDTTGRLGEAYEDNNVFTLFL